MANSFKNLTSNDVTNTRTLLHEAIPITGSIVSGTYGAFPNDTSVKNYAHGMFQSVYDYPYLSSSANQIFDITVGVSADSIAYSAVSVQQAKKKNIYNQMAQILVGYDNTGSVRAFDQDGDLSGGSKYNELIFINFSRLLVKDEIKKGSFEMQLGVSASSNQPMRDRIKVFDSGAANSYKVNSPAGEYGILYATNSVGTRLSGGAANTERPKVGLVYYQAGIVALSPAVFEGSTYGILSGSVTMTAKSGSMLAVLTGSEISGTADSLRNRIYNISFNNTTELNSTIYFVRAGHNEFNYSSNPTYLSSSQIRVKNNAVDQPLAYFTTVGLYSADNELLAVAKLSEPLRKDSSQEYTLRVRLDY